MLRRVALISAALLSAATLYKLPRPKFRHLPEFHKFFKTHIYHPMPASCDSNRPYLGCSIRALESGEGMIVLVVNSGSPAESSGITRGDIIIEIQGVKIQNINDFRQAITLGTELVFTVLR